MILLDADHLTLLRHSNNARAERLAARIKMAADQQFGTSIICVEEQWRGWFALISRFREPRKQLKAYSELMRLLDFLVAWQVLPFNEEAAEEYERIAAEGCRIGTMDMKIAAIARSNGALLLSANISDFGKVSGLRVENWLD